jgi:uncharacterized protein (TIGR03437 family)
MLLVSTPAAGPVSATPPWPTRLGGISLEVRDRAGAVRLAPLLYVSGRQVNFQVPAGTAPGEANLAIVDDRGSRAAGVLVVEAVAPGVFILPRARTPAATAVRAAGDGSHTAVPLFTCSDPIAAQPEALSCRPVPVALDGDPIYISFYGTGFRGANSTKVACSINGVPVPVSYAGPQGTPGVDQINVRLDPELQLPPSVSVW